MTTAVNGFVKPTREESLNKILAYADDPKTYFVEGYYSDGKGCHCAIGVLFTPRQLTDITRRGCASKGVGFLTEVIGKENLEFVTGLNMDELEFIQVANDSGPSYWNNKIGIHVNNRKDSVRRAVRELLEKKVAE